MIDVVIIDDDEEYREKLASSIDRAEGFRCRRNYGDCETAIANLEEDLPDVVLMDIGLPRMSGVEGVSAIKGKGSDVEIIMLTIREDSDSVFESLRNGASGYLVKDVEVDDLLRMIKEVTEGGSPMSMRIARMVTESFRREPPPEPLSSRQLEVLTKLCEGKSYLAIANELFISKATVKFHIKNIYRLLHAANKAEAIVRAKKQRIV
jgi:DNA-binding NarL/FixJ family response regulator